MSSTHATFVGLLLSASMAASAEEPVIVAGIEAPQPGLSCNDAADDTRVHFHFNAAAAEFTRVTLYVDGEAAEPEDVEQAWPTVTLAAGMHPGRNLVEIVATRADGARVTRRMPVTLDEAASGDGAFVPCGGGRVVVEDVAPTVVYQEPMYEHHTQVIYQDAPRYVYEPYPAYPAYAPVAPLISFDLYSSRYHPWHHDHDGGSYRHEEHTTYQGGGESNHEHDRQQWHQHDAQQVPQQYPQQSGAHEQHHSHDGPAVQGNVTAGRPVQHGGAQRGHDNAGGHDSTGHAQAPAQPQPQTSQNNRQPGSGRYDHPRFGGAARDDNQRREQTQ